MEIGNLKIDDETGTVTCAGSFPIISAVAPETLIPICVMSEDGRVLFRIHRDGRVDGDVEDASEAARIFVQEVRRLMGSASES